MLQGPGKATGVRPARVDHHHSPQAPEPERWTVADRQAPVVLAGQAPRRWTVGESKAPSVAWTKEAMRRWRVIVDSQAAKACLPHNPCREAAVQAVVVPAAAAVVPAVVVVPAAAEEDKEGKL